MSGRRAKGVLRPAGPAKLPVIGVFGVHHLGPGGAVKGDQKLERAAQFGRRGVKLGREDKRADHLRHLIGCIGRLKKDLRQTVHQPRIRIIRQEPARDLGADVAGGSGVAGKDVQHLVSVRHRRAVGGKLTPKHPFLIGVMPAIDIKELPAAGRRFAFGQPAAIAHRPAGKGAGDLIDIKIKITFRRAFQSARHRVPVAEAVVQIGRSAKGVQFQQFTGEILVRGAGGAVGVVQVIQHGRAARDIPQKRAEIAESVTAQQRVMGGKKHGASFVLGRVHVKMVVPELGHHLAQLARCVDGADRSGGNHVLCRAGSFAVVHALAGAPVKKAHKIGRISGQRVQRTHFIQRGPCVAVFIRASLIRHAQACGGKSCVKGRVGHRV